MPATWNNCSSDEAFAKEAAHFCGNLMKTAVEKNGQCIIALSGGSTPKSVYEALGDMDDIDWKSVHVFLIDERYTASDSPDSNAHLVSETLLKAAAIPEENIYMPDTMLPIEQCIERYNDVTSQLLSKGIDLAILGMGNDGHIASLFPPLPPEAFGPAAIIHTVTDTFAVPDRLSVTVPVLRSVKDIVFLLKGDDKKQTWDDMIASGDDEQRWPAKALLKKDITVFHQSA
jgi:6-phosphogluconolactonase